MFRNDDESQSSGMKPLPKWQKKGDFSEPVNTGDLRRRVEYIDAKDSESFFIGKYVGNDIQIAFKTKNKPLLTELFNKFKLLGVAINDPEFLVVDLGRISLMSSDKNALALFLNTIDAIHPIEKSIKKEIFNTLELKQLADPEAFLKELADLVDESKIDEAIQKALAVDDDNILPLLGQYCESKQKLIGAIECYKAITKDNPNYQALNEHAAHVVMQIINLSSLNQPASQQSSLAPSNAHSSLDEDDYSEQKEEQNQPSLTNNQIKYYQELQLKFMLNAEKTPENQRWVDIMLHQLSGGEGLIPVITEAKRDTKTLLSFAHQTSALHDEVSSLKEHNQELLAKIALLEAQLAQAKKTTVASSPQSLFGAPNAAAGSSVTQNDSDPKGKNGP